MTWRGGGPTCGRGWLAARAVMQNYAKKVRYLTEYAAFRLVAALLGALPLETASAFNGFLWRKIAPLLHRHQRAVQNLRKAMPDKTMAECEVIARDMWENLGRTFAEGFHLREIAGSDRVAVPQAALFQEIAATSGGKLFCSGHFANWELMAMPFNHFGIPPVSVYQKVKNPFVDNYVRQMRSFIYPGGMHPKDHNTARKLIRLTRNGATLIILTDLRDHSGIEVEFFGLPAPSTPFPALLVQLLDLPLYIGSIVRTSGVHFEFTIRRLHYQATGDRKADIAAVTSMIHAELENIIRANPAQWMWGHRRWG